MVFRFAQYNVCSLVRIWRAHSIAQQLASVDVAALNGTRIRRTHEMDYHVQNLDEGWGNSRTVRGIVGCFPCTHGVA